MSDFLRIVEVSPRDGLQNEKVPVPTEAKLRFIEQLRNSGLQEIEVSSFVSPKWVPQLGDVAELWSNLPAEGLYSALVPNEKGLERAIELGVDRIAVFTATSDAFTQKNINMSVAESMEGFSRLIPKFREAHGGFVRGYVSTIFECPYAGKIEPTRVREVVDQLFALGVDEVSLGDTIGVGSPQEVAALIDLLSDLPKEKVVWHFHDTYGLALANVMEAIRHGYRAFDSSAAGLGGCPYAKGASGNLATEDLVYLAHRLGMVTGVDLGLLSQASREVLMTIGKVPTAKAQVATLATMVEL